MALKSKRFCFCLIILINSALLIIFYLNANTTREKVPKTITADAVVKVEERKGILDDKILKEFLGDAAPDTKDGKGTQKKILRDKKVSKKKNLGEKKILKKNLGDKKVPKKNVGDKKVLKNNAGDKVSEVKSRRLIPRNSSQSCSPQTNIMFVKPHKTGTSTVQNLLLRFAVKHRLLLAMPHPFELNFFKRFNRKWLYPLKPGNEYNIFALHAIFDYEEMRAAMPDNTTFITILRDPVAQFESAYSFFQFEEFYGMNISTFAALNRSDPAVLELQNRRKNFRFGRNQQAFSLGIRPEQFDDEAFVLKKIQELDAQIDLALITGSMDQSLVLLKDELCWNDFWDVVSIQRNSRKEKNRVELSEEVRENLRQINRADQMIYDHFYQKFNRSLEKFGAERMKTELAELELAKEEVSNLCLKNGSGNEKVGIKTKMKKGAKSYKICANLLNYGRHFSANIFERTKEFYVVSEAEVEALKDTDSLRKSLQQDPNFRFLLKDLGYADRD